MDFKHPLLGVVCFLLQSFIYFIVILRSKHSLTYFSPLVEIVKVIYFV